MRLFVDADACPVIPQCLLIARRHDVAVTLVCDDAHDMRREGAETLTVLRGADSADFALVNRVQPGDVVVTQVSARSCGVIEILGVRRVSRLEVRLYIPSSPFSRPAARPSKEVSYLVMVVVRLVVRSSRLRESLRSCFSEAIIR